LSGGCLRWCCRSSLGRWHRWLNRFLRLHLRNRLGRYLCRLLNRCRVWPRCDVNFRIIDDPSSRPCFSVVLIYDVEEECAGIQALVPIGIVGIQVIFRSEVCNPFVTVVVNFTIRSDRHSQRPPAWSSDHGTRNIFATFS